LTNEALRDAYNDEDVRRFFFEELLLPFGESMQRQEYRQRAARLKRLAKQSNPRLLDIGCAAGNFLQVAAEQGFEGEGLELNSHYVDYIKQHRSLRVFDKRLDEMAYAPATFDVVTLWDVLEHIPYPFDTLKQIARILRPGGILALTTINHQCINEKILGARWRYYQPPDHVCSFSPALLTSMLHDAQFEVITIDHHYLFEVLWDAIGSGSKNPNAKKRQTLAHKAGKIIYLGAARLSGLFLNAAHEGDLLTVLARRA
jgi:2-polyprenyl-3-methyl-5-hydroxy-6-metoxy-1,4-benzoquinol methylase